MRRRLLVPLLLLGGAVLLLLLIGQTWIWPSSGEVYLPPLPSEVAAPLDLQIGAPELADRSEDRVSTNTGEARAARSDGYRRSLGGLRGRVVYEVGHRPLAGVEVRAVEIWLERLTQNLAELTVAQPDGVPTQAADPLTFVATTRTDQDGVFELTGVHSRASLALAIGLRTQWATVRMVEHSPAPGRTVDLSDIVVLGRGTVAGRVLGPDGQPVAGARIRTVDVSEDLTLLRLHDLSPGGLAFTGGDGYQIALPLPAWVARYDPYLPFAEARSDAKGTFLVQGVRRGRRTLWVQRQGLVTATSRIDVETAGATDVGDVELDSGYFLRGRFRTADGKPTTGVRVAAGSKHGRAPYGFTGRPIPVDAEGRFLLSGLAAGDLWLLFQRHAGQPWEVSGPHSPGGDIDIRLAAPKPGRVIVEDMQQRPVTDVAFLLFASDSAMFMPGYEQRLDARRHLIVDPDRPGSWSVRDLPGGEYKVIARAEGFALGCGLLDTRAQSKDRELRMRLAPGIDQVFEVTDARGAPIDGASIYWDARNGRGETAVFQNRGKARLGRVPLFLGSSDGNGRLAVNGIEQGATRFLCRHPGHGLNVTDRTAGSQVIRFVLPVFGRIEGRISDRGHPPAQSYTLLGKPTGDWSFGLLSPRTTRSNPDGTFCFVDVDPGSWRISILEGLSPTTAVTEYLPGGGTPLAARVKAEVVVEPGTSRWLQLELGDDGKTSGRGELIGTVRLGGEPAIGAAVQTWRGQHRTLVDEQGRFRLQGLRDGDHWIGVELPGAGLLHRLWEGRVQIRNGDRQALDLNLPIAPAVIVQLESASTSHEEHFGGTLLELSGLVSTSSSAESAAQPTPRVRLQALVDARGQARFSPVPQGSHRLRAIRAGGDWTLPETRLEIAAGAAQEHRVRVVPASSLHGSLTFEFTGLTPAQTEYAKARQPRYLVFEDDGQFVWGPVRQSPESERRHFAIKPVPPGRYRFVSKGDLTWTGNPVVAGSEGNHLVLRPDRDQLIKRMPDPRK